MSSSKDLSIDIPYLIIFCCSSSSLSSNCLDLSLVATTVALNLPGPHAAKGALLLAGDGLAFFLATFLITACRAGRFSVGTLPI